MKKNNIVLTLMICVLLSCLLVGCSNQTDNSANSSVFYSFTDDAGTTIHLKEQPKKVAVLFSSLADVWLTAGGKVSITVGESVERGFVSSDIALVDSGAGKTIDRERLISYEPDFVICSSDITGQAELAKYLNTEGIPCAQFQIDSFDDYADMLKICTDITGNKDAYKTHATEVQKRIEKIKETANKKIGETKPEILFIRAGSKYSATKAKTAKENFVCAMLNELGTYNIAEKAPVLLDGLSFEEILTSNPKYIFISTMGDEKAAKAYMDEVMKKDGWQQLDAVKNGRYTYLSKDLFQFKPNAKWDEAYQILADYLGLTETE